MRVLVADDDPVFLEFVENVLTRAGYKVRLARSGEEGLDHALELRPNLIILDVILPGLWGTEVSRKFKRYANTSSVRILLVSAKVDALDEVGGDPKEFLADDFLPKPFSPGTLLDRVSRLPGLRGEAAETTEPSQYAERRKHPRMPFHVKLTAKTAELYLHHPMINISSGGFYIEIDRSLEIDQELDLQFSVPGQEEQVSAVGKVAWCMELEGGRFGTGIRFTDLPDSDLAKIQKYVQSLTPVVRPDGAARPASPKEDS
jgi:uncharacterized protein (TIGR02266 family)